MSLAMREKLARENPDGDRMFASPGKRAHPIWGYLNRKTGDAKAALVVRRAKSTAFARNWRREQSDDETRIRKTRLAGSHQSIW